MYKPLKFKFFYHLEFYQRFLIRNFNSNYSIIFDSISISWMSSIYESLIYIAFTIFIYIVQNNEI